MPEWINTISLVLAIPVSILTAIATMRLTRKQAEKEGANAASILTSAALAIEERTRNQISDLEKRLVSTEQKTTDLQMIMRKQRKIIYSLFSGVKELISQVTELGHSPRFVITDEFSREIEQLFGAEGIDDDR